MAVVVRWDSGVQGVYIRIKVERSRMFRVKRLGFRVQGFGVGLKL